MSVDLLPIIDGRISNNVPSMIDAAMATTIINSGMMGSVSTVTNLKDVAVLAGKKMFLGGKTSIGDGLGGFYYWDDTATDAEDTTYLNIIPSNLISTGRWKRTFENVIVYPQGILVNIGGIKKFYASGTSNVNGEIALNLTKENTSTGTNIFSEIWSNISRVKSDQLTVGASVTTYTKTTATSLKTTTHACYKPNPVTLVLGLLYNPLAAAGSGINIQFEITGI